MPHKEFTAKRKLFCKFYTAIGTETYQNGTQSAIKAGYSARTARSAAAELLAFPHIREYVEELDKKNVQQFDWTLERFQQELVKCYESLPPASANKAKFLEMIGKIKRYFEPEQTQINIFNSMSAEQIKERMAAIKAKIKDRALPINLVKE